MYQYIKFKIIDNIAVITLNRPEKLNAWHRPMRSEFLQSLEQSQKDESVKAIVVTGGGDRGFCAGQDFNESKDFDGGSAQGWVDEFRLLYKTMRTITKPIIAALNGVAAGSGFQAALLTDIRIAHPGVLMGQPEINSGIASITGPWIMKEMLGLSRTLELTLTGRLMEADECYKLGLIHEIVPAEKVLDRALQVARDLAAKSPTAMKVIKQRFWGMVSDGFEDTFDAAARFHRETYGSGEPQQCMNDFLKR